MRNKVAKNIARPLGTTKSRPLTESQLHTACGPRNPGDLYRSYFDVSKRITNLGGGMFFTERKPTEGQHLPVPVEFFRGVFFRKNSGGTGLNEGFMLVEALVSISILSMILLSFFSGINFFTKNAYENEMRSGAVQAGQKILDQLRLKDPRDLPSTVGATEQYSLLFAGRKYPFVVDVTYCTVPSMCRGDTTRHVKIRVNYNGSFRFSAETVFTRLTSPVDL